MQPIPASVLVSIYPIQGTITFVLNLLSIVVFWKRRANLRRASYFLVNLAVADSLVGAAQFTSAFLPPSASRELSFSKVFVAVSKSASLYSLVLISLERLFAVWKPLFHRISPRKYYYIAIGLLWPWAAVNGFLWMIYVDKGERTNVAVTCILVTFILFTLLTISSSYVALWYMVKLRPRPVSHNREQNKQLTKTLFIVTALSLLTWVPSMVGTVATDPLPWQVNLTISSLLFANSLLDPIVYIFRMREFRNEIKKLLCKLCT